LVQELVPETNKWESIGVCLGLTAVELERIGIEKLDEINRFTEVLYTWKKRGNPSITWNTVIDVLRSPLIQEQVLAKTLHSKYCSYNDKQLQSLSCTSK